MTNTSAFIHENWSANTKLIVSETVLFLEIAHSTVILMGVSREKMKEISNNSKFDMSNLFGGL